MNIPNKITFCRIILSVLLIAILVFPFHRIGLNFPEFIIGNGKIIVDSKYFIAGIIFVIASLTDFLDGHLARKYNLVTDFGKVIDAIADKLLVNGTLIILAVNGYISVIVPVIIVSRDVIVDSIKMVVGSKSGAVGASVLGKAKTAIMLVGVTLMLFYNLPFELWNLAVADLLILIATVLSVISGIQYYSNNKQFILDDKQS